METKLVLLADRPDFIPTLCEWFVGAWAPYYGIDGPGDAADDLRAACQRDAMPVCVVAVDAKEAPVGTASLKSLSVAGLPACNPWLTALIVRPDHAGRGIAEFLVQGMEQEAARRGEMTLYCDVNTEKTRKNPGGWEEADARLLISRGWKAIGTGDSLRGATAIYKLAIIET